MVQFMEYKVKFLLQYNIETQLSLCTAYTDAFLYKKAYDVYKMILDTPELRAQLFEGHYDAIMVNQRFCAAPLPWFSGPKNVIRFRYCHSVLLKLFGGRRCSFLRDTDVLEFNSQIRRMNNK